ncbi:hypothetical protein [Chitinophaga japonensis]|uniref:Dolichyl-phosphate-mannose-protein mannosyltransferase n=1 Tax=Chitinophaga japonensis TaxID=104662 RepID=A0A562SUP2_CHIJA|nr:hypothetical protein [Chitinophaga japonensis]TWI84370.1 hypothetical protein LX66_4737 [Chitinophaga japonensis]
MTFQHHTASTPFSKWLWQTRERKLLLGLAGAAVLIQFSVLKYLYPFPNFLPDSYSYLETAFSNQFINMWPIGYSRFLRLLSVFTKSHMLLTLIQYLLLQASMLYLVFTVAYLLQTEKWVLRVLLGCNILNPLLLHISNFVSSDALFATLSLIWFTQLIWIIYKPGWRLLLAHAIILLLAFTVRYNALYYPLISMLAIALCHIHTREKIAGIAVVVILTGIFIAQTIRQYRSTTGTTQFSAFGGWQLASNALFAYAHVPPSPYESVPAQFSALHALVNWHNDSLRQLTQRPDAELGVYYLWDEQAPLKKYVREKYREDSTTDGFKRWASMGPLYGQYGRYLIQQYPIAFTRYYLWPNILNYYSPPLEFLGTYNMGKDSIEATGQFWFGLKSNKVHVTFTDKEITSAIILPVLLAVINLVFIVSFFSFLFLNGLKKSMPLFRQALWIMLLIWFCNAGFSILASPIVLRYQAFPMVTTFTFTVLLVAFIIYESGIVKTPVEEEEHQLMTPAIFSHYHR